MFKNRYIPFDGSLLDALKKMDALDKKLLIVLDKNEFAGLVSAGDIQRALIKNRPLTTPVREVLRKNIRIAKEGDSLDEIKEMMFQFRMELCPVVSKDGRILLVHYWEDVFQDLEPFPESRFELPVVIMAGGLGTRMRPITHVLPKPLIPIGEKTIIEEIFRRFNKYGCSEFYISVNYKADLIQYYLENERLPYRLTFFKEKEPMGTAGSLSLLRGKIQETFFVSNCDILINQDYSEMLDYHRANQNELTIVAALRHYPIPYGTVETGANGKLERLTEKPELTFKINSGMYILEPHLIEEIPSTGLYHITNLIEAIKERGGNVGVFPVSEGSWIDIGNWAEYSKVQEVMKRRFE